MASEDELIRQAMSVIGSRNTDAQQTARRRNISAYHERIKKEGVSEDTRKKLEAAQRARRERERAERAAAGVIDQVAPKRPRGRPRTDRSGERNEHPEDSGKR